MQSSKGVRGSNGGQFPAAEAQARVAFVSRRTSPDAPMHHDRLDPMGDPWPTLAERTTLLLVLLTVILQAFSWSNLAGYQLADSVEFMDRAYAVVRGEALDTTGAVRSFGFSTLLLPFFALAQWLGLEDMRIVVHVVRLFQMLMGVGLVLSTTRLGARLGGRSVGYVAGFLVAANPIFLQYSVDPVSGITAAFLVALSLDLLIERRGFARSLAGGLLLGVAFMMAYQILLIAVPLVPLLFLRDRFKVVHTWLGALLGLTIALLAQVALDKVTYGTWGLSVSTYIIENTGGTLLSLLATLGLQDQDWVREAYANFVRTLSETAVMAEGGARGSLQSPFYYISGLPALLVPPAIVFGLLGLARAWKRMNWKSSLLLLLVLVNVFVMSLKGSKSFRLWLPLLPMIAPLCALGWEVLANPRVRRPALWRRIVTPLLLLATLALGVRTLEQQNTRRFGAYWQAMEFVNDASRELRAKDDARPVQVTGAAYNWAIFCRNRPDVRVLKLREHLDQWAALTPEQRAVVFSQLDELDWLIVHGTILRLEPDLTIAINERFGVAASFWDPDTDPNIRDVRVLRRLDGNAEATAGQQTRRLFEVLEGLDPQGYRERLRLDRGMPDPQLLVGARRDGSAEQLTLLGYEIEPLPGADFSWITYHWTSSTGFDHDYVLVDRVSTLQSPWSWQNNHQPAHGTLPTSSWVPGTILRESYLLVPGTMPFSGEDFHPFGGCYRRGDLLPASLWIRGEALPPDFEEHELLPADLATGLRLDPELAQVALKEAGLRSPEGYILSADGLVRAGKFLLPVAQRYRWPDDGGPGPDDRFIAAEQSRQALEQSQEQAAEHAEEVFGVAPPPGTGNAGE